MPAPGARTIMRIAAGLLALMAFAVTGLRLYFLSTIPPGQEDNPLMPSLMILLPLSLGPFFGYLTLRGRLSSSDDGGRR